MVQESSDCLLSAPLPLLILLSVLTSYYHDHLRICSFTEPEPSVPYRRQIDDTPQTNFDTPAPDYTAEWQHIYLAANNLFSFIAFLVFAFVAIIDLL